MMFLPMLVGIMSPMSVQAEVISQAEVEGVPYTISLDWNLPDVVETNVHSNAYDFFVHDDVIYLKIFSESYPDALCYFNAETGSYIGSFNYEWNGVEHKTLAGGFVGVDTKGQPYASSFATLDAAVVYPHEIYPIDFKESVPSLTTKYILPQVKGMWTREIAVSGDIKSGNFTAIGLAWPQAYAPLVYNPTTVEGNLLKWTFVDGKCTTDNPLIVTKHISHCTLHPCSNGSVIAYDLGHYGLDGCIEPDYDFVTPTLININEIGELEIKSVFDGEIKDPIGANGLDVSEINGKHFMLYGSCYDPASYSIAYLPNYPNNLENAQVVWTSETVTEGDYPFSDKSEAKEFKNAMNKNQVVRAVRISANETRYYLYTNNMGLARVTVRSDAPQTGIEDIAAATTTIPTYYTLDGRHITAPTAPGIYLRHQNNCTEKIIIK